MNEAFEKRLNDVIEKYSNNTKLYEAFKYSLTVGGKRLRPLLCLSVANSISEDYTKVLDLAVAIEFIHNYSLVHDDLPGMDNDKYRRSNLTTHAKFGEYVGILTGDALLTEAFSIIAKSNLNNKDKIIEFLCDSIGMRGMIYGQYLDMLYENKKVDEKTLKLIHKNKTGALIRASIICPLLHFNKYDEKYEEISCLLGYIYQLQDDIFDSIDKEDNSNYVNVIGLEKTKAYLNEYVDKIKKLLPKETSFERLVLKIIERKK